jgi:phosphoenolpyruvate-protein kinase (PTS system EI component)
MSEEEKAIKAALDRIEAKLDQTIATAKEPNKKVGMCGDWADRDGIIWR